jgi:hypothetical protein
MPLKEMAACMSACTLSQALGATLGIAIFQAVISSGLASRFPSLPGYGRNFGIPNGLDGYRTLHSLGTEEGMRALEAFSLSLRVSWVVSVGLEWEADGRGVVSRCISFGLRCLPGRSLCVGFVTDSS